MDSDIVILRNTSKVVEQAGYGQQVKRTETSTLVKISQCMV